MLVGLVINPIAGMGGSVGLKGTDGRDVYQEAVRRGAHADIRGACGRRPPVGTFLTGCPIPDRLGRYGRRMPPPGQASPFQNVYDMPGETSPFETMEACAEFVRKGVSLIVFCGGDGTARDVLDAVGDTMPIVGIPAGVKMHSGVFLNSPSGLGPLLEHFLIGDYPTEMAEVADVDESAVRDGRISDRVYGYALTITRRRTGPTVQGRDRRLDRRRRKRRRSPSTSWRT